jgi:hypothetical protein
VKRRAAKAYITRIAKMLRDGGVNPNSVEEARLSAIDSPDLLFALAGALQDATRRETALEVILAGRSVDELKQIAQRWICPQTPAPLQGATKGRR